MSSKESNEVTIKVISTKEELIKILTDKQFKRGREFSLDDYYFIPNDIDKDKLSTREILSKAVIIRYIIDENKIIQKITFKRKNIDEKGNILSQDSVNCDIKDIEDAKRLFKAIGYSEIMNIKENDIIYYKNNFELELKFVKSGDLLIEIETEENTEWDTIDKIKKIIDELNLPIEKNNYFIKKAENELNKILKR